jgi:hypothetical protein
VGSSGILRLRPHGPAIDSHDAIFRLNAAPASAAEYGALVGVRTTVRFVNAPQSSQWQALIRRGQPLPPQLAQSQVVLTSGTPARFAPPGAAVGAARARDGGGQGRGGSGRAGIPSESSYRPPLQLPNGGPLIAKLQRRFRSNCVLPLFSQKQLASHLARTRTNLTPTFGFEAIAHALYACERVHAYGFYLDTSDTDTADSEDAQATAAGAVAGAGGSVARGRSATSSRGGGHAGRAAVASPGGVPYHYFEARSYDKAAADPSRPWTFRSHNYAHEADTLRALADACVLTVHV